MKKFIASLAIAATVVLGAGSANAEGYQIAGVRIANPFDSATWWEGSKHEAGETVEMNFMDPDFWMAIPNPEKHSKMHGAFTNPATYGQFMKLDLYKKMVDLDVLKKWFEVKTYDVLLDPQTYAYWMQPGAYQHLLNVEHYTQIAKPEAYGTLVDDMVGMAGYTFNAPSDLLSPSGWMNAVSAKSAAATTESDS